MNADMNTIAQRLEELMATGTEAEVKQFIVEHFRELPEETQREFAAAMFEDALSETVAERFAMAELKTKAVEVIDAFNASGTQD